MFLILTIFVLTAMRVQIAPSCLKRTVTNNSYSVLLLNQSVVRFKTVLLR